MQHRDYLRLANVAALAAGLLAVSLFPACSKQAAAQALSPTRGSQSPVVSGNAGRPSRQTPLEVLHGKATMLGHYDPEKMLRLAVVLALPHPVEERKFLEDVQNKQSPLFHQFLSSEEWAARFGPSVENEQAVVDWAQSQGLTVTHRYGNRIVVDLEGKAGAIEKALNLNLNSYLLPAQDGLDARTVYSNDRDPILPENLNGVVDAVLGLNSVEVARPRGGTGPLVPRPDYVPGPVVQDLGSAHGKEGTGEEAEVADNGSPTQGIPTPKGYPPSYFWSSDAYNYQALMNQGHCCNPLNNSSGHSPRESSIAIASFGDVSFTDVSNFATEFGLNFNVTKIGIDGGYTCNNSKGEDGNCGELSMDTEWSLAMANNPASSSLTSRVVVYEGSVYSNAVIMDVYTQMEADAHARTMSTSWGWAENTQFSSNPEMDTYNTTMQSVDKVFSSMSGEGWTLLASSGDNGATDGCGDADRIDFPSSDPNVTAVGGTTLNEGSVSSAYEVGWTGGQSPGSSTQSDSCDSNHGGSTGGFSEYWGVPGFQSGMGFKSRATPDISLDATHGHDVLINGAWAYLGGTSVSTPMMAGFFAQENAYLLSIGSKCGSSGTSACAPIGNANYPLYEEARQKNAEHSPFYDILSGCNSNDVTTADKLPFFCAGPGFDEVTGWGSANMLQLAWAINWELIPASGLPYVTWSGPATNKWYNTNQTVSWTIHDYVPKGGTPGSGIAGETQGWDSLPADPSGEPHGGSGNSFYAGPQFPNGATGCLAFEVNGCSGGVSQGCHTAYARGWSNQGWSTAASSKSGYPESYGPLCYDTVDPTISLSSNPLAESYGWHNQPTTVTLTATDPGGSGASGVASTYYGINSNCAKANLASCLKYTAPLKLTTQGVFLVTAFSQDKAGNFSPITNETVRIDTTPPQTTAGFSGALNGNEWQSAVTIVLKATDNLSGVYESYFALDGGGVATYSGPIKVSSPGSHTFKYWSTDVAGNTEAANLLTFIVESLTTVTLAASPNPAVNGEAVTLKATVSATLGGTLPGIVTFYDGSKSLGTGTVSGGVAKLTTSTLPLGSDQLSAVYGGGVYYQPSNSIAVVETVFEGTATTLKSSLNPAPYGAAVILTATVKASISGTPAGSVTFFNDATALGTVALNSSGVATLTTSSLAIGSNMLFARYAGNATYEASSSATVIEVIDAAATTVKVTSSVNPSAVKQSVTFTATVTPFSTGTATGSVTFKDGTTALGTETLAGGKATFTTTSLAAGAHSITAVYGGSTDYLTSTSAALTQTVSAGSGSAAVVYVPDFDGKLLQIRGNGQTATISLPGCNPNSVAVNSGRIYVVCNSNVGNADEILVYPVGATSGTPAQTITNSNFDALVGITFDSTNNLWVANGGNSEVDEITAASLKTANPTVISQVPGIPLPEALAFDKNGSLWITSDFSGGILYNITLNASGQVSGLNSCVTSDPSSGNCQYVSGLFTNLEGVALFNGDVWVSNTTYGELGDVPGRELIDLKYTPGTGGALGTFAVNAKFGSSSVPADSPFVCPSGLFAGTAHLWINDDSYGETNPQCGANGDSASKTGGIFEFTPAQLTAKDTTVSQVLAYPNIAGRPGFGGIYVDNDQ